MPDHPSSPYREDLCRSASFTLMRAEDDEGGDGLTVDGYGAVFNSATQIDSWEGTFAEAIAPGAFRKSLRERTPIMQFDHGHHPLIGSLPLGRWDVVEEDAHGLHTVGRLSDNWLMEPVRDAIRDGGVTGMSFRFSVVRDEWTDKDGRKVKDTELPDLLWYGAGERGPLMRTLKEVRVSEVGPVTWPAYQDTSVGVRSAERFVIDLGRLDLRTPHARSELARAVALADAAAPKTSDAAVVSAAPDARTEPQATVVPAADEHPAPAAPPVTAEPAAGEHSSALELRRRRISARRERVRAAMTSMNRK
jgi:HK97 family phage prohead protease